jgi:PAS domain S-box-containing protein
VKPYSAESALLEEKAKSEAIIAAIGDGISIQDTDYKIIYQNQTYKNLIGDHVGEYCYKAYEKRDTVCEECPVTMSFADEKIHTVERVGMTDKGAVHVEVTASPLRDAGGKIIAGIEVVRNITERKRMEESLRNIAEGVSAATGETFFRLLVQYLTKTLNVDYAFVGELVGDKGDRVRTIAVCDRGKIADNFEYDLANTPCENVVGKTIRCYPQGVQQQFPLDYMLSEMGIEGYIGIPLFDSAERALGIMAVLNCRPMNEIKTLQFILQIFAARASAELDRGWIEKNLQESEKRYKMLVESATDYIYTVYVENGHPVSTSHGLGCVAVTGYTSEEYNADPYLWYRMVHDEDKPLVKEQAEKVIQGMSVPPIEHRIIHKNGQVLWVRNTSVPRCDDKGNLIAYDGMIKDITEQKQLELQLHHAQKMEAIGTLAGGIAHDFNNMLTTIVGYGSLLRTKLRKDTHIMAYVESIIASAEKAANLAKNLLAFSRKQIISPNHVNLNEIVHGIQRLLSRLIGEDIELKTDLTDKNLIIRADVSQIEQILMNLVINARDAMHDGGILTIKTEIVEMDDEYVKIHGYGRQGNYALITVSDTGIGMDKDTKERIFEPFFTTKEVGKGTGLGLSIVYGIVKQHNGYINCYSESKKGTTFKIYLPIVDSEVEDKKFMESAVPAGGTETILTAEDNADVRKLIKEVLEGFGYTVIEAEDGEEAVMKFMENKDKINLLLFDVIMPRKNGKDAYEEIKNISPDIRCIFMSGYSADIIHKKGVPEGEINFISKPVSPKELLRKVREVLDS